MNYILILIEKKGALPTSVVKHEVDAVVLASHNVNLNAVAVRNVRRARAGGALALGDGAY
jgi:hypothetical protein